MKKPVAILGHNNGLTEGMLVEIKQALKHHVLINVMIASEDIENKTLTTNAIVRESGVSRVQIIGNILVLYRPVTEQ